MTPMEVIELSQADKDQYNRFVAGSQSGSFLQSWEWGGWQEALGRKIFRYWILDDIGERTASIQLIKMPLPFGRYYLYSPYGPVASGQWTVDSGQWLQELQRKFKDAIFIRIEPKSNSQLATRNSQLVKSNNIQPGKTLLIDLSKSEDQLLAEMHHKTRYNIKVAQKHGVEIKDEFDISVGHGLFASEAVELIANTAARQGFKGYGADYYNKLIDFFVIHNKTSALAEEKDSWQSAKALATADAVKNRADLKLHIYKAIYQNKILASAIMVDFGKTRTFLFGGSAEENKNVMAPYLLHWQAMLDARARGMAVYDFWGTETASGEIPGFVRFKLGFGGQEASYPGAYDVIISKPLYKAYSWLRLVNKITKKISPK
jgi:lipid II:glycine glycyltransferase (peptidoglycan interpeptide bridge formation enzyme)